MSTTPTPRTSSLRDYCHESCTRDHIPVGQVLDSHEQLERELAEARENLGRALSQNVLLQHGQADVPQLKEAVASLEIQAEVNRTIYEGVQRELAEARESEASETRWAAQYKRERDEAREQRDSLAEALKPFTTLNPTSKRVMKFWDGFVTNAREALAAVKGGAQ